MRKFLRLLPLVLAALLLGSAAYRFNAETILGNKMPMPLGFGVSVVLSGSMEPELSVDDLVIIRRNEAPQVGDIAVYQEGSMLVIHRIIGEEADSWIFQGDANNTPDSPVPKENVKGTLALTIPGAGGIVTLIRRPAVILCLAALALLLGEGGYRKEKKKDTEELARLREEIQSLASELKEKEE